MKRPYVMTLHYKNKYISKFNLKYKEEATDFARDNLIKVMREEKVSIHEIKRMFELFVDQFYKMRVKKVKCKSSDHKLFMGAFLGLMKMNVIQDDNENGFIITKRKPYLYNMVTYKEQYNTKYKFKKGTSHSLKDISKTTGYKLKGLQTIYDKGIGAFKTNPQSVRPQVKSKEQWGMARVYASINPKSKAYKIDKVHLVKK